MTAQQETIKYEVDAQGKRLGHVASHVAVLLMGKNLPQFQRNRVSDVAVSVSNASLMDISSVKKETKTYNHYSFYPGGRKEATMNKVIADKGYSEVLSRAIKGMLPKNKLQTQMMKNLTITE